MVGRAASTAAKILIAVTLAMFASSLSAGAQAGGYSDVDGGFHAPSIDALSSDPNLSGVSRLGRSGGARRWGVSTTSRFGWLVGGLGGVR